MGVFLQRVSSAIIGNVERFFYFWGYSIAKRPWLFISGCVIFTIINCLGLVNFYRETRPERLFIPYMSNFYITTQFLTANFPPPFRQQFVIIKADDILQPQAIQKMLLIHQKVSHFKISSGRSWQDQCFQFPVVTSMGDDLELLKGFRNRVIMKRDISTSNSTNIMEPLDMFQDDFINGTFEKQSHNISTPENAAYGKHKKAYGKSNPYLWKTGFDDFESEFSSNAFANIITNITDFSVVMPSDLYCAIIESVPKACWEFSLLELWKYDADVIGNLTKQDIVNAINTIKKSPVFGSPADYRPLLGGAQYDTEGNIISATSLMTIWHIEVNYSNIDSSKSIMDIGFSDPADPDTLEWEDIFVKTILSEESEEEPRIFVRAWKSIADLGTSTMTGAITYIVIGGGVMFTYIVIMMSELNIVDARIMSSMMGILSVGMALVSSIGICSAFGVFFGPLHLYIGIILLGLGVDDMFVIAQCYNTLPDTDKTKPLPEKIGLTLRHAGASITVTSLTNCIAFSVGSSSIFPTMSSLCIYLAVGIVFLFIYQATFFVGFFVLEQRRISQSRNSIIFCYQHHEKSLKPKYVSGKGILQLAFNKSAPLLGKSYFKIVVIIATAGTLCVSGWGLLALDANFQIEWMVDKDSYLVKFCDTFFSDYQTNGEEGMFILANINYTSEMETLEEIVNKVNSLNSSVAVVDDWYSGFKEFVNTNFHEDVPYRSLPKDKFLFYLGKYLFSPNGAQHQRSFRFEHPLRCGEPAPPFQLSLMPFRMQGFKGAKEHVPGMQRIRNLVEQVSFENPDSWFSAWCYMFFIWEADERVLHDTLSNLIIASAAVFVCTLTALANVRGTLLAMSSVCLTLIEMFGFYHVWNIQINFLSSLALVVSIGMSVDFAIHITHSFLTTDGTKNHRAVKSFRDIGPAVFNGGVSTMIAYSFLYQGNTTALDIFLKTNILLVTFGLCNGLILLPILLSIIGPAPYAHCNMKGKQNKVEDINNTQHNPLKLQHNDIVNECKQNNYDLVNTIPLDDPVNTMLGVPVNTISNEDPVNEISTEGDRMLSSDNQLNIQKIIM